MQLILDCRVVGKYSDICEEPYSGIWSLIDILKVVAYFLIEV